MGASLQCSPGLAGCAAAALPSSAQVLLISSPPAPLGCVHTVLTWTSDSGVGAHEPIGQEPQHESTDSAGLPHRGADA